MNRIIRHLVNNLDDAGPDDLAREMVVRCIDRYLEAQAYSADVHRRIELLSQGQRNSDAVNGVSSLAIHDELEAQAQVLRSILMLHGAPPLQLYQAEAMFWPACGVRHGGKLWIVQPDADEALTVGYVDPDGRAIMNLVVVDVGAIATLD